MRRAIKNSLYARLSNRPLHMVWMRRAAMYLLWAMQSVLQRQNVCMRRAIKNSLYARLINRPLHVVWIRRAAM